ncbi:MAG: tRNA-(ms[2]io[6]A)-hydroxylase [bacterium]|nr:tRNA-(ms[2]io[6]A)-hydroxylase [bacterium]
MLCLQCPTNAEWIDVANAHPEKILVDHAHCEKKAAAFALALINRYPDRTKLVREMIGLATEELEHLALVLNELELRSIVLSRDKGNAYVQALHTHVRPHEPLRMMDWLIIGAFIEARSCERFSILAEHAPTEEMRVLYKSLLASEAGHYRLYFDIAREYFPEADVRARIKEFGEIEAAITQGLTNLPTMHG